MLIGSCHCRNASWKLTGDPGSITACNCTLCRSYGALWAYGYEGESVRIEGPTKSFRRPGKADPALEILFCDNCAGVLAWRGLRKEDDGRTRMAVNIRLAPPHEVADLSIDHFDGLATFEDLPPSGKVVRDLWA